MENQQPIDDSRQEQSQMLDASAGLPSRRADSQTPATIPSYAETSSTAFTGDACSDHGTGGLVEYWRILRRRKETFVFTAFAGAILGFLIALPQNPIYQARTSVEILGLNENFLNIQQVTPVTQTGTNSDTTDIQTEIKILQSDSLLRRVAAKLDLDRRPATVPEAGRIATWRQALNLAVPRPESVSQRLLNGAAKSLKVRSAGQTRIVELFADSTDAQFATDFLNTLTSEFIDQNLEARWKTNEHTSEWLSQQLDEMRIKLERSDDALQDYARSTGLMFTDGKNSVSEDKLRQLQQALTMAQAERVAKQARYEMVQISSPENKDDAKRQIVATTSGTEPTPTSALEYLPDGLDDATLKDYQAKITDLKRQMAELRTTYTPAHFNVKKVAAQLAILETARQKAIGSIRDRIVNDYEEAKRHETLLAANYDVQSKLVTQDAERAVQYNILKREVESNRQLYDAMLQQLKQATIASAMRASNVHVVDPATLPNRPYKPDIPLNTGLGLMTGFFIGAAFIVMRERADRSIQNPRDTPLYLNVPELGIIPTDQPSSLRKLLRGDHAGEYGHLLIDAPEYPATGNGSGAQTVELATWQRKPSVIAESFRTTLVSILYANQNGNRPRVLVLTSPGPNEGKSTVVSNLGIALAEVKQRVLLIDADLRKPRQHDIFSLPNNKGLMDILLSDCPPGELPEGIIQPTLLSNLFVLTSGTRASSATSLLYANRMAQLLAALRKQFDTILIDTPPMLNIADARVLARISDKVILVIRAGKTTRDAAVAASQRLIEDGTPILGTILNDWNPKRSPNGYYGYYDGYYQSYYRRDARNVSGSSHTVTNV